MKTKLDLFLEKIDPDNVYNDVGKNISETLANYKLESNTTDRLGNENKSIILEVYRRILECVGLPHSLDWIDFGEAVNYLKPKLGNITRIYDNMSSGLNGGIYGVLKVLAEAMEEKLSNIYIQAEIEQYWNDLSTDERDKAHIEYVGKFRHILPEDAEYLLYPKDIFLKYLEEHPQAIKKLRSK